MKKEVLRIRNLNMPYQERRRFHWVSMILFEGECTALRGLSFSGKDDLVRFLTMRRPCNVEELGLFIDSERIRTTKRLEETVYRIAPRSRVLRDWTCAEYIALAGAGWLLMGRQKRALLQKAQDILDSMGISLDAGRTLRELSEKEMRFAELARACMMGARVLVVEDELEGLTEEEITEMSGILQSVAKAHHLTVIINVHSDELSRALAEHYIIFRDGRIVKKCRKTEISSRRMLEDYMLGPMTASRRDFEMRYPDGSGKTDASIKDAAGADMDAPAKDAALADRTVSIKDAAGADMDAPAKDTDRDADKAGTNAPIMYRMRSFPSGAHTLTLRKGGSLIQKNGSLLDFSFRESSVTTFLILDEKLREDLFMSLSGRDPMDQTYCVIGNRRLGHGDYAEFVRHRVVSVMHLGSREELFGNMSVGENLVLPSIRKLSFSDYLLSSSRLTHALDPDTDIRRMMAAPVQESDVISRIAVTMERWYLFNPKVMILLEPFERCDLYGVSIVRSSIRKLSARGTCVILIQSREEYTEDISDDIFRFD